MVVGVVSTATATIAALAQYGIPCRSAGSLKTTAYASAITAVHAQSIATQCAGRNCLSTGERRGSMP